MAIQSRMFWDIGLWCNFAKLHRLVKRATTFSITALSIMTLSIMGLFATLSIKVAQHKHHSAKQYQVLLRLVSLCWVSCALLSQMPQNNSCIKNKKKILLEIWTLVLVLWVTPSSLLRLICGYQTAWPVALSAYKTLPALSKGQLFESRLQYCQSVVAAEWQHYCLIILRSRVWVQSFLLELRGRKLRRKCLQ